MAAVQEYKQELKFETFSYLPPLTSEETRAQIQYIISQGWNPSVEHVEPQGAGRNYWFMWKLPFLVNKVWIACWRKLKLVTGNTRTTISA